MLLYASTPTSLTSVCRCDLFLWGWLETVSNTEPINNGFSELPAPVRAAAAALRQKARRTLSVTRELDEAMKN